MTEQNSTPTRAYDLLEPHERQAVDDYVKFAVDYQNSRRERIAHALEYPIPTEQVRRSKGVLAKPLARAAVAEKIQALADEQDLSPSRVIAALRTLGLDRHENVNYPRGLKSLVGMIG